MIENDNFHQNKDNWWKGLVNKRPIWYKLLSSCLNKFRFVLIGFGSIGADLKVDLDLNLRTFKYIYIYI